MSNWNYTPEHPITLSLSADARLSSTDYTNDQIWELNTGSSAEPVALSLQTTFGLRARTCRIFPRFTDDGIVILDPAKFIRPITIQTYYPNYLCLSFRPFSSINVIIEYWVPNSHTVAARVKINNSGNKTHHFQLEWSEHLLPSEDGRRMAIEENGMTTILTGHTSNLTPVFFLAGGAKAGNSPYPSLNLSFDLPPHGDQESRWVNVAMQDVNSSFNAAKEVMNSNWEAELSRIQRVNAQQLEIVTGNHAWNTAFFLAQTYANQLIHQATDTCLAPSFVIARSPDQGFSSRKDGADYNHLWNGQTAFDAYYFANFLLPAAPEILRGLLDNFLATQLPDGEIDWKPGLGGQRSQLLATPLLASLGWSYFQYSENEEYLKRIFPQLQKFYFSWFSNSHDRDRDSIPEWDHTIQTGFDEHPIFSHVHPWSIGADISTVESPDLVAYLYHEGQSLISIARVIGEQSAIPQLESVTGLLRKMLDQTWNDACACYQYRDRDSHLTSHGEILAIQKGSGIMEIQREFSEPVRPFIFVKSKQEVTHPIQVYIHAFTPSGAHRVDHISSQSVRWHLGSGFITSDYVYQAIEQIEITGVTGDVEVIAQTIDLSQLDQTLLLPLWAGVPSEDQAKILVNLTIFDKKKFLGTFGLRPSLGCEDSTDLPDEYFGMRLPWISLVLEGMVRYGMHEKAAQLFTRWMEALVHSQNHQPVFHHSYHCETAKPNGSLNQLTSLVPIGLFLKILGVNIINPSRVEILHHNPFPWPVTIKFRGLLVVHQDDITMIYFPDGQSHTIKTDLPQMISLVPI
jgi:hypothetical protein